MMMMMDGWNRNRSGSDSSGGSSTTIIQPIALPIIASVLLLDVDVSMMTLLMLRGEDASAKTRHATEGWSANLTLRT